MPHLTLPKIPEVSTHVLGASQLNTYRQALDYLLGKSHASYALNFGSGDYGESGTSYSTKIYLYLYHDKNSLYYAFTSYCSGTWYASFEYYGDDSAWHQVKEESGSNGTEAITSGTQDLSGEGNMTAGNIYSWRIRIKASSGTAHFRLYGMGEQEAISGWVSTPSFTNGTQSSASDFNALRTDAQALDTMLPPIEPMANMGYGLTEDYVDPDANTEDDYIICGFRYRPDTILVNIRLKTEMFRGAGYDAYWKWHIYIRDQAGTKEELYDSGWSAENTAYKEAGGYEWQTQQSIDLPTATSTVTLTMGNWYQIIVTVEKKDTTTGSIRGKGGYVVRRSDLSPSGSWPSMSKWSMGDTDIGNTRLSKFSTALDELYTGGGEELWGQHPAVGDGDNNRGNTWGYFGVHSKRWLVYTQATNATIYYGANFSKKYSLADTSGWASQNLGELDIPWGGIYYVVGVEAAWEADNYYG